MTNGTKLTAQAMKALKGGYEFLLFGSCASATGLMIVLSPCQSNADCPVLPLFCCGQRVTGYCDELGTSCTYENYICG